jgi:hypothetical protein
LGGGGGDEGEMKLAQKVVNAGCEASRGRFNAMTVEVAKKQIAYDLQGFLVSMVDRREWTLPQGLLKMTELIDIIAKENGI